MHPVHTMIGVTRISLKMATVIVLCRKISNYSISFITIHRDLVYLAILGCSIRFVVFSIVKKYYDIL